MPWLFIQYRNSIKTAVEISELVNGNNHTGLSNPKINYRYAQV